MSHDEKSWEEFNKMDPQQMMLSALYTSTLNKLTTYGKNKGSNYTPPKKKRKKK
jgi:hypothetical protein